MWHLTKIPKIAHFYWGGTKLSYLRFMSVKSFRMVNPEWEIQVHVPTVVSERQPEWESFHQKNVQITSDWFDNLDTIDNLKIIKHDFDSYQFDNFAHEVHKSDFLRWKLLDEHGGLWSDIDILYTKPMLNIVENVSENNEVDTMLCPLPGSTRHTVGFLLSKKNNNFFQQIGTHARKSYNPKIYQCMGSDLINVHYPTFESLCEHFKNNTFAFLDKRCVYSITSKQIELFYQEVDQHIQKKINNRRTIGFHWFAGHPRSQEFENKFVPSTLNQYNNLLSTITQGFQDETCN